MTFWMGPPHCSTDNCKSIFFASRCYHSLRAACCHIAIFFFFFNPSCIHLVLIYFSFCPPVLQNDSPAMKKAVSLLSLTTPNSNRKRRHLRDTLAQLTKETEISPFPPPRKRLSAEPSMSIGSLLDISNTPETCKAFAGKRKIMEDWKTPAWSSMKTLFISLVDSSTSSGICICLWKKYSNLKDILFCDYGWFFLREQ